jgi:hypothetical protein
MTAVAPVRSCAPVNKRAPAWSDTGIQGDTNLVAVLQVLHDLSRIQQHILGCVAVHSWTHDSAVPFVAPNPHQFTVAMGLAAPGVRLLDVVVSPVSFQQSFRLSRLGAHVVPRLFLLVSADDDQRRELEFTKMRRLMQNAWETRE